MTLIQLRRKKLLLLYALSAAFIVVITLLVIWLVRGQGKISTQIDKSQGTLEKIAQRLRDLLANPAFVGKTFHDDMPPGRRLLHHDPETDVYVLAHIQEGQKVGKEQKVVLEVLGLLLSQIQGKSPAYGILWHGKACTPTRIKLSAGLRRGELALRELTEMSNSSSAPRLMLNDHCRVCEFRKGCLAKAEESDSLTLLDRMTPKLMRRYEKKGILTVTQLSYLIRPRRRKAKRAGGKGFKVELQAYALRTGKSLSHKGVRLPRVLDIGTRRPPPRVQGDGASTGSSPA